MPHSVWIGGIAVAASASLPLQLPSLIGMTAAELVGRFAAVDKECEFDHVQRRCGVAPIGPRGRCDLACGAIADGHRPDAAAERIRVMTSAPDRSLASTTALAQALHRDSRTWLLYVTEGEPAGQVDLLAEGLLRGGVTRLWRPGEDPESVDLPSWLAVLANAWFLVADTTARSRLEDIMPPPPDASSQPSTAAQPPGAGDIAASVRSEAAAHRGAGYLAPTTLRVTASVPVRFAMIGSCLMDAWDLQPLDRDIARIDTFLLGFVANLPDKTADEIAGYDFVVIQPPLRSIIGDALFWHVPFADTAAYQQRFEDCCGQLAQQLDSWMVWNRAHGLLTFVANFMVPQANPMGRLAPRYDLRNPQYFIERLNERLEQLVRGYRNAYLFDIDRIVASLGRRFIQDDAVEFVGHGAFLGGAPPITDRIEPVAAMTEYYDLRWPGEARPLIWAELAAMYRTVRQIDAVKLVVVDLDDTLWRGVSGEMAEIDPAAMTEGWPLGFAEALMYLRKRGILLAIISKNDDARVRAHFPEIWGQRLALSDFAAVAANWRPKPDNMAELLATMNLLPRSVVFIDDNPAERAAMQAAFPDMRILGRHLYWLRRVLLWSAETDVATITEEAARRTEMMQRQLAREDQRKTLSREDFLTAAAPRVEVLEITGAEHPRFARALELINRTNQFNTTGRRWTAQELVTLLAEAGRLFGFTVADSFTNYGLVGVVIVHGRQIVQWVMSCRVLGYGIEQAVMAALLPQLRGEGAVTGTLVETNANQPCRELFSGCGFVHTGDDWVLAAAAGVAVPQHVTVACHFN